MRSRMLCGIVLTFSSLLPSLPGQGGNIPPITRPVVSEDISPLESIAPVAQDGYRGQGFLRKPPGDGPFPALVWIHGGLTSRPVESLKEYAVSTPNPSRFLAAGYVVAIITYRRRDEDPQSRVSLEDSLAAVDLVRRLPFAFYGSGPRAPRPAAALKAFQDSDSFFRRHLKTKPKPIDPKLVKHTPIVPA
jgi:hypothetical protein